MKIELPSPRKPAPITPKQGSLYHEMGKVSPRSYHCGYMIIRKHSWVTYWQKTKKHFGHVHEHEKRFKCFLPDISELTLCFPPVYCRWMGLISGTLTQSILFFVLLCPVSWFHHSLTLFSHVPFDYFLVSRCALFMINTTLDSLMRTCPLSFKWLFFSCPAWTFMSMITRINPFYSLSWL